MANVYRADHVGTLIKPNFLLTAQVDFAAGKSDAAARRVAEDAAISEVLVLQKAVVMSIVTDGEYRRAHPDEPYVNALEGLRRFEAPSRSATLHSAYAVCGTLRQTSRLAEREVSFLKDKTQSPFKICLMSPSALALRFYRPGLTEAAYRTVCDLATTLGDVLRSEVSALFQEGVRYVQLSSPAYHALFEGVGANVFHLPVKNPAALFEELLAIDVTALNGISKPSSATLAMQIGRILELSDASDRYERMAVRLLEQLPVDRVLLEYGEPREHDFVSLKALPAGKMAVLGLVRSDDEPEEIGAVIDRVDKAARMAEEHNLALSPRRGFCNAPGRDVAAQLQTQHRSLLRVSEVVQQFWGLEL